MQVFVLHWQANFIHQTPTFKDLSLRWPSLERSVAGRVIEQSDWRPMAGKGKRSVSRNRLCGGGSWARRNRINSMPGMTSYSNLSIQATFNISTWPFYPDKLSQICISYQHDCVDNRTPLNTKIFSKSHGIKLSAKKNNFSTNPKTKGKKVTPIQATVSPGFLEVRARRLRRTSELRREDLPTLERPTSANSGNPSEGQSWVLTLLFTNSACMTWASLAYLLSKIFEPFKILDLKLKVEASEGTSVSGGTKSFSSEIWTGVSSSGRVRLWVGSEVVERVDLITCLLSSGRRLKCVL